MQFTLNFLILLFALLLQFNLNCGLISYLRLMDINLNLLKGRCNGMTFLYPIGQHINYYCETPTHYAAAAALAAALLYYTHSLSSC